VNDPHANPPPGPGLLPHLLRVATAVSRHRRLGIALVALATLVTVWIVPTLPSGYTSRAVVQLRKSLVTATAEDAALKPTEAAGQITEDYREVQTGLLTSRILSEAVATRLVEDERLDTTPSFRGRLRGLVLDLLSSSSEERYVDKAVLVGRRVADAADWVDGHLVVKRTHKSPLVTLAFRDVDAERARDVLVLLLEAYKQQLSEMYSLDGLVRAAESDRDGAMRAWEQAQEALHGFSEEHGLSDPPAQLAALRSELDRLDRLVTDRRLAQLESAERARALEQALARTPEHFASAPTRLENRERWLVLDLLQVARERQVVSPFVVGSPEFDALQGPVNELLGELEAQPSQFEQGNPPLPNISYYGLLGESASVRAEAEAAAAGLAVVADARAARRAEFETLELLVTRWERLDRTLGAAGSTLDDRTTHLQSLRRVAAMGAGDLLWSTRLVQAPGLPTRPDSAGRGLLVAVGFAAAVVLVGLLLSVLGLVDRRVRGGHDVTLAVGAAPLVCIPHLGGRREVAAMLGRLGIGRRRAREHLVADGESADFESVGPHAAFLRARVDALLAAVRENAAAVGIDTESASPAPTVVALSGTESGAGTTTLARNLAGRLSRLGEGRVLLIQQRGDEPVIDPGPGLDVLTHDDTLPSAARGEWLQSVGQEHRWVVIDTPPVLASDAGHAWLRLSDVCLLVARGEATERAVLREAAQHMGNLTEGRVGVVVNGLRYHLGNLSAAA